ncbi:cellulosome protein, partial [Streptomyces boncukensis]
PLTPAGSGRARAATESLTVDLSAGTGPVHGGAAGSLYGVYGDGVPTRTVLEGMHIRTVCTKAQDGVQHPGADALEVLRPFVDAGGADLYVYMTDIYRGFPYQWPGVTGEERLGDFMKRIRTQVEQALTVGADYRRHLVYVPFNEPEGNMFGTGEWSYERVSWRDDPRRYFAAWKDVHALIRGLDPEARIAGPNTSILYDEVKGFLEFAKENGVLPDIVTWHELSTPATIRTSVAKYRRWEKELGIGPLPVNINEYAYNYHISVPGQMVQWIAAIEESKVDADLAYWNIDGNLGDSAVMASGGNAQWWLYHAYGALTGDTVEVTAPHPGEQYTLQGVAALDRGKRQARVLFGGADGGAEVVVKGIDPGVFGRTVRATLHEIPWSGQVGDAAPAPLLRDARIEPGEDGTLTVPVGGMREMSAYQLLLAPGEGGGPLGEPTLLWRRTYEAEDAAHTGSGWSRNGPEGSPENVAKFATSGGYDVGGLRTGSDVVLTFEVEVPQDGTYDLSVFANSYNEYDLVKEQGPTNVFLRVDGGDPKELLLPLGYKWVVWDHTDARVELSRGRHTLTLAARDPRLGETRGDAIVDKLDLALRAERPGVTAYEAAYAELRGGGAALEYGRAGARGIGTAVLRDGARAVFWVHAAEAGETAVRVDHLGGGTASLALGEERLADVAVGGERAGTSTVAVVLGAGLNKLTLAGTSGALGVDRLRVTPSEGVLTPSVHQAEDGELTGAARVTREYTFATGGRAVTDVGDGPDNALTLQVTAGRAGQHALAIRYSNAQQAPATHYNPDPVARHADVAVNGAEPVRVLFPTTFHFNNFRELTVPVELEEGRNAIRFTSAELPDFDGESYNQYGQRSPYAPVLDRITVTPLARPV